MPYVVDSSKAANTAPSTTITLTMPIYHASGDVLIVAVQQDAGTGTLSLSPGTWTGITTQAAANGQRLAVFWKYATSSSEPAVTVTSTLSDDLSAVALSIRGVHATTPIHSSVRQNTSASTSTWVNGGMTTTVDDCLIVHAYGLDGAGSILKPVSVSDMSFAGAAASAAGQVYVGTRNQATAGAIATPSLISSLSFTGGTIVSIAIVGDGSLSMAPEIETGYAVVKHLSSFTTTHDSITHNPLNSITSTIDGVTVSSTAPSIGLSSNAVDAGRSGFITVLSTESTAGAWVGTSFALGSAVDFTAGVMSIRFGVGDASASAYLGPKGVIMCFKDSAGAWAAIRLALFEELAGITTQTFPFTARMDDVALLDSGGGAIDWTDITRIGFGQHRTGSGATSKYIAFRGLYITAAIKVVGGSAAAPIAAARMKTLVDGWTDDDMISVQAGRQTEATIPVQFGSSASTKSYVNTIGMAFAFPRAPTLTGDLARWRIGDDSVELRVRATSTDTVNIVSAVMVTEVAALFVIDPASSASATYNFSGLSMIGWKVENSVTGVALNGVTMAEPKGITLNGGSLENCSILDAVSAVSTTDPSNISDCYFRSAGGHAIEITTPGTYTFSGNTFAGYGADGTTDAAVYNNSGGAVTLNISGGGDTPTVRNGAGASTIVSAGAVVTFDGINAGSEIRVFSLAGVARAGVETCDANHVLSFDVYGAPETVVIRIVNVLYKIKEFTAKVSVGSLTIPVQQELDPWYKNP